MHKHQIPVIFLNERSTAHLFLYPKESDVHHVVKVAPSVRISSQINCFKVFIKNNSSPNLLALRESFSASCYFFRISLDYHFFVYVFG